jgi:hypothetical protein
MTNWKKVIAPFLDKLLKPGYSIEFIEKNIKICFPGDHVFGLFKKKFRSKNKVPKENIVWIFFYDFLWGICTGTKGEFRIFEELRSNFSLCVCTGTNYPRNRREKFNKHFLLLGICTGPYTLNFETLGTWCYLKKKI